jgi:hypothetical protein
MGHFFYCLKLKKKKEKKGKGVLNVYEEKGGAKSDVVTLFLLITDKTIMVISSDWYSKFIHKVSAIFDFSQQI